MERTDSIGVPLDGLTAWLRTQLQSPTLEITRLKRMSGGAIQENWRVDTVTDGVAEACAIRMDSEGCLAESHSRSDEFAILQTVHSHGVCAPKPIGFCEDLSILGKPFAVTAFVPGVAFGPRIVKDVSLGGDREKLLEHLGRQLARIHQVAPPRAKFAWLGAAPANPAKTEVHRMRSSLDRMRELRPALEWGLRWAELNAPASQRVTFVHRDFRTGNYLVDASGLKAILDWEFAGWGDPMADLGWFCAECWRFSRRDLEAGGIGSRLAFYRGYEEVSGTGVDDQAVRYWEVVAHLRWAVIALAQGLRHSSGAEPSLALALTGRICAQLELAIVRATGPARWIRAHAN